MRDEQAADEHSLGGITLAHFCVLAEASSTPPMSVCLAGGRRRVTGLGSEEVAVMAGISTDCYLRVNTAEKTIRQIRCAPRRDSSSPGVPQPGIARPGYS